MITRIILSVLFVFVFNFKSYCQLDLSFGNNGHVNLDILNLDNYLTILYPTHDNDFLVGGSFYDSARGKGFLKKYNSDGSVDSSFAMGLFKYNMQLGSSSENFFQVCQLADSSYYFFATSSIGLNYKYLILKLTKAGVVDSSYGMNGKVLNQIPGYPYTKGATAYVYPNGNYLIGGTCGTSNFSNEIFITKHSANGLLDSSFGTNGVLIIQAPDTSNTPMTLLQTASGDMLLQNYGSSAGIGTNQLIRMDTFGNLQTSFGVNGIKTVNTPGQFQTNLLKEKNSELYWAGTYRLQAGSSSYKAALVKTTWDGDLINTFGTNGMDTNFHFITNSALRSIEFSYGNQLFLSGFLATDSTQFFLIKKNESGVADSSFGSNGLLLTHTTNSKDDNATQSILLKDASWIVGGHFFKTNAEADITLCKVGPVYPVNTEVVNMSKEVEVYPNPFTTFLVFASLPNNATVQLYSCFGKKIAERKKTNNTSNHFDFDILPSGLYFYRVLINNTCIKSGKVLKN